MMSFYDYFLRLHGDNQRFFTGRGILCVLFSQTTVRPGYTGYFLIRSITIAPTAARPGLSMKKPADTRSPVLVCGLIFFGNHFRILGLLVEIVLYAGFTGNANG